MTPTEQDNELFELCKKCYEATGWENTKDGFFDGGEVMPFTDRIGAYIGASNFRCPLYTSDYLLEKLPNGTTILKDVQGFKAWNVYNRKRIATYTCDSPVEALLKLTLKLHEEGLI